MKGDRVIIYTILHMKLFIFNAVIIYESLILLLINNYL